MNTRTNMKNLDVAIGIIVVNLLVCVLLISFQLGENSVLEKCRQDGVVYKDNKAAIYCVYTLN